MQAQMDLAITSIQRNRGPWIMEWLAFHMVVGFNRFFLYAHQCDDDTVHLLLRLAQQYPIVLHQVPTTTPRPQLVAYQHAWQAYGGQVSWMAFIDGDEFLFPTQAQSMRDALAPFAGRDLSALAAYWVCYGSSGHLDEPQGLVLENYTRHAGADFPNNRHVKSMVRGGEPGVAVHGSHVFETPRGTFDGNGRRVTGGYMVEHEPCYQAWRINHYVTQSWQYFCDVKQRGGAADVGPHVVRPDTWFHLHDRNECDDGVRYRFLLDVKRKLREMERFLGTAQP